LVLYFWFHTASSKSLLNDTHAHTNTLTLFVFNNVSKCLPLAMCSIHLDDATPSIVCQNAHHTPAYWWRGDEANQHDDGQRPKDNFGEDAGQRIASSQSWATGWFTAGDHHLLNVVSGFGTQLRSILSCKSCPVSNLTASLKASLIGNWTYIVWQHAPHCCVMHYNLPPNWNSSNI